MDDDALLEMAEAAAQEFVRRVRTLDDFRYDEQQGAFWDLTTGNLLSAASVNGAIPVPLWATRIDGRSGEEVPVKPAITINAVDTGLTVEGSTWWPGKPRILRDLLVNERGARALKGAQTYNTYQPPPPRRGNAAGAGPWLAHVRKLYPDPGEHEHFLDWAAHAIQRPHEKVNHGIVMAGQQGIGKDSALMPIRAGVGEWNVAEISPDIITGQYNGYVRSVLLVVNEVRPQDEQYKASAFYNLLKPLLAAPPMVLPVVVKFQNPVHVPNVSHVVLTTNDPLSMYIPEQDRRLFVMTSPLPHPQTACGRMEFAGGYFEELHAFLTAGGVEDAIAWLGERSLSEFKSAAPPPASSGKDQVVHSASEIRRTAADDVLELFFRPGGESFPSEIGDSGPIPEAQMPPIVFHDDLVRFVCGCNLFDDEEEALKKINARTFHFRMSDWGYDVMRSPHGQRWERRKFRARNAFILRSVPQAARLPLVMEALEERAAQLEIAAGSA